MIPLKHDDDLDMELAEAFGVDIMSEICQFCEKPTRFRHEPSVTYICPACAKKHTESELPEPLCSKISHKNTKAPVMTEAQMALRESDDDLFLEQVALEKKLHRLRNQRRTIQSEMKKAGLTTKRPVDAELTPYNMRHN